MFRYQRQPPTVAITAEPARIAVLPPTIASAAPARCTFPLCTVPITMLPIEFAASKPKKSRALGLSGTPTMSSSAQEEKNALQVERRMHQVRPGGDGVDPEIADVVVRIAISRRKTCGGDRLEDEVPDGRHHPERGPASGSQGGQLPVVTPTLTGPRPSWAKAVRATPRPVRRNRVACPHNGAMRAVWQAFLATAVMLLALVGCADRHDSREGTGRRATSADRSTSATGEAFTSNAAEKAARQSFWNPAITIRRIRGTSPRPMRRQQAPPCCRP